MEWLWFLPVPILAIIFTIIAGVGFSCQKAADTLWWKNRMVQIHASASQHLSSEDAVGFMSDDAVANVCDQLALGRWRELDWKETMASIWLLFPTVICIVAFIGLLVVGFAFGGPDKIIVPLVCVLLSSLLTAFLGVLGCAMAG